MKQDLCALLAGQSLSRPWDRAGHDAGRQVVRGRPISSWAGANSRNRVFAEEPDGIRTQAADPARMEDPSLIIYHPVRQMGRGLIVTNGDQTDTILEFLKQGLPMEQALRTQRNSRRTVPAGPRGFPGCWGPTAVTSCPS